MAISFKIKQFFPVSSSVLFHAWLDSETHSQMTGGSANCTTEIGGEFNAWDKYISGENISITKDNEIVQSWRTVDFKDTDDDSKLTLRFEDTADGCAFTLIHENIPDGQPDYEQGWKDNYIEPMINYFG